jgi:hypothetical protein
MLHGAPLGFVVIGTLVNYEDRIFIPTLNDVYGFHRAHEKLFTNVESVANVALVRGNGDEYRGIIKLLSEEHILFDILEPSVVGTDRTPKKLGDYQTLILPDVENMDDRLLSVVDSFVRNGGHILAYTRYRCDVHPGWIREIHEQDRPAIAWSEAVVQDPRSC